jgi:hypothetical protein
MEMQTDAARFDQFAQWRKAPRVAIFARGLIKERSSQHSRANNESKKEQPASNRTALLSR